MAENNNLEIVISASDQASAMLESINQKLDKLAKGAEDTEAPIKSLGERFDELTGGVQDLTQPLADAAQAILAMETAALALGAAMVKVAIDEAGKFEQSLNEINTVLGLTPDQFEKFKEDILDYASTSTQSIEQINGAVYAAVSAGTKYEDALKALSTAEQLAVAGNADLEESITLLTSTTNAYGPALSGAEEASDIFFQTVQLGATTVPELNQSLGNVIPVAAALGIPLKEVGAVLATVTTNGINTSEATTGLKAALSNIISPSKEAKDAAAELGVEFGASALETNGLVGLLAKLDAATGGNAEEMKKLFGSTEAYTLVMSLTNDRTAKLQTNLEKLEGATGSTAKAADEMAGSLTSVNQKIANSIDLVQIRMGDEVLDEYKALVQSFAGLFNELADSIGEGSLDAPLGVIEEFLAEFSDMVDEIAAALPEALGNVDWSGFEESVADLGEAFSGLFEDVDLTTPEGLGKAIQGLIDTGSSFIKITAGIVEGLSPLFTALGAAINWFNGLDPEVKETAGYLIGLGTTVNTLAGVMQNFSGLISGAGGLISGFTSLNPVVLAVATAFGAYKFGEWIGEISGYNEAWDKTVGKLDLVGETVGATDEALARSNDTLDKVAETLGVSSLSMEEFNQAVDDGKLKFNEITGEWELAGESAGALGTALDEGAQYFDDWGEGANLAGEGTKVLAKTTEEAVATLDMWNGLLDELKASYDKGNISQEEYAAMVKAVDDAAAEAGVNLVTLADAESDAAKSAKEAAEESEKFALAWEELLSAERTAIFEAQASIQVAQIEADSERAVAAMDMLTQSFQSTGDVLTELFGLWANADDLMDQSQLSEWIEREYEIREQLAQAQIDLINAEIARMEAQTAMLENGGMDITIQSDGLEPELEAFMYRILDRIRVQVAGSYQEFLLGCGK